MQVKKFEAPTIQEALESIKRELGPEAIILQTKRHKKGFGLMSSSSVEVTAAVSEKSMLKKQIVDRTVPEPIKSKFENLSAEKQRALQDDFVDKHRIRQKEAAHKRITATRYAEIDPSNIPAPQPTAVAPPAAARAAQPGSPMLNGQMRGLKDMMNAPMGASDGAYDRAPAPQVGTMSVEQELSHLKRMISELKSEQENGSAAGGSGAQALMAQSRLGTPALQDAFEQLVINGLDKRVALNLIRKVSFELGQDGVNNPMAVQDQLASELMSGVSIESLLSREPKSVASRMSDHYAMNEGDATSMGQLPRRIIALVGPTGVGKTTTLAKIASEALIRRNAKVGLINLDSYKVAAFDQLSTYGKILNVPFRSVATADELQAALRDFKNLDLVLIDTTGRSQRDPSSLKDMQQILNSVPEIETQLVLSVTTRDQELYEIAHRFSLFRPEGLILSKLDEASIYGALFNVADRVKLPLTYFTTGQRVPEDIEEASRERVAALILDI